MMDAQTETFARELKDAILEEVQQLEQETQHGEKLAAESKIIFTDLVSKIDSAFSEGADLEEFLAIDEIFTARRSTVERAIEGHPDILFNDETGKFIEPKH